MKKIGLFYFKCYKFIFSILRRYYYKDDLANCYGHTLVMFFMVVAFPFIGILILLDIYPALEGYHELTVKLIMWPFFVIAVYGLYRFLKVLKYQERVKNIDHLHFDTYYTKKQKIKFLIITIGLILSLLWIPLLYVIFLG